MPNPADITAIVVSYNSAAVLGGCLSALAESGVGALVVDNASGDDSAAIARAAGAAVLAMARNEGYGRANNAGVVAAATPFVLICNPDLTVTPQAIAALGEAARQWPEAGLWAPLIVEPDGRLFVQPRSLLSPAHLNAQRKPLIPEGPACLPFVSGACFLMRRELFLALGGFDPEIFLFYEDDDLCRRLLDRRLALLLVPAARVTHLRGQSSAPSRAQRHRARWHGAWSAGYIRRKYGLPPVGLQVPLWHAVRAALNALTLRFEDAARYGGSLAGDLAFRRGVTAKQREGLS
jgi:GT2 family glycosyltransferase